MYDVRDVLLDIAAATADLGQARANGDAFDVAGTLRATEGAVEGGAEAGVQAVPRDLTHAIDVNGDRRERDAHRLRRRFTAARAGHEHPRVEDRADDRAAPDELVQLLVGELAVVRHEGAAIRVAGPQRPAEVIEGIPQALVAE